MLLLFRELNPVSLSIASLVGGVELNNTQLTYLSVNIFLIVFVGIGLTIWKTFQSRNEN